MVISKDFKEFIKLLNEHKVEYLIVGGYAVAFHGYPRYTKDLDVWIWLEMKNATKLLTALKDFGFEKLGLTENDFLDPNIVVQLGYPPNRIDIITDLSGVDFRSCFAQRVKINIDDLEINFIDLENLKRNKKAVGRFQDLADIENLE